MKCILPVFNYSNLVTCEIKGQLTPVIKLELDQMSSLKLFGQLVLIGGQVVGKIVSSAYKQALANVAKNPNISKDSSVSSIKGVMTIDEASKILNCPKNPSREELVSRFEHLFKANDRKNGGSFYLQSKVARAREALEAQLKEKTESKS